eukprot:1693854-Rhodomonas_salina.1
MQGNLLARALSLQAEEAEAALGNNLRTHDLDGAAPQFVVAEIGQTSPLATASNTLFITLQFDTHIPPKSQILIDNINCIVVTEYDYATEECDDGNNVDNDGCNAQCVVEICGDGVMNDVEECDDGNIANDDGCTDECKLEFCGDSVVNNDGEEECDDGNMVDGDGCSASCKTEFCGDNITSSTSNEECDDGNIVDGDAIISSTTEDRKGAMMATRSTGTDAAFFAW